jgi:hypothetical protein
MTIRYKENIVLFMDVLGFSNLVYNKDQNQIESYFTYVLNDFNKFLSQKKYKYLLISDSIVVSCKSNKENLSELIFVISKIQYQLLLRGILLRGGISFGNLYINKSNNIIVGPGLINAYQLEKSAKYPRIILDRRLISNFFDSTSAFTSYINSFFKKLYGQEDEKVKFDKKLNDGWPYINYLRKVIMYGSTYRQLNMKSLVDLFKSNYFSNQHFEKYHWLLTELLEELSLGIEHYTNHPELSKSKARLKQMQVLKNNLTKL